MVRGVAGVAAVFLLRMFSAELEQLSTGPVKRAVRVGDRVVCLGAVVKGSRRRVGSDCRGNGLST